MLAGPDPLEANVTRWVCPGLTTPLDEVGQGNPNDNPPDNPNASGWGGR